MLKYKLPGFISKLKEVIIFNFFISILKCGIFIYAFLCDLFFKDLVFVNKIDIYNHYKIRDRSVNKYYDIILIDDNCIIKKEIDTEIIKERLQYRNLFAYCSLNEIDITEDVRKFVNYYDRIDNIPWYKIYIYLIYIDKIKCDEKCNILLIDNDLNEMTFVLN